MPSRRRRTKYLMTFIVLFVSGVLTTAAMAQECTYNYWEVIPKLPKCEVLHLPDFDFRQVPAEERASDTIRRFCTNFEVSSKESKQRVGYCYTGEGDVTGPTFEVNGKKFLLDLSEKICVDDQPALGIVVVVGDWRNAPKGIRRLWPVESLPAKVSCKSESSK